ncbi:two-component system response regulator [Vibrio cholerae]|nr:two-component system response regulator [Vibrio cholerae]EKF6711200.1 two-component system response regulator [Vibrio cholerae]EKF6713469.1 two-component system response regulator [Vibrio cholerae]
MQMDNMHDEKLNVLLLDDENDILKALNRVLRMDYNVVTFDNGADALEYLQENPIHIIISDMRMPEMDGADFLAKAREMQPDTVRLLLTGYADIQSTVRAVNAGGIHTYISKPWDNENLKLIVGKAAEFYRLSRDKERLTIELEERNKELEVANQALAENNHKLAQFNQELEAKVQERTVALQESNKRLESLLASRNKTFKDILAMVTAIIQHRTGFPADHAERIANQAKSVALKLKLSEAVASHVYLCGLMHQIGLIAETSNDWKVVKVHQDSEIPITPNVNPILGAEIVGRIKRFEPLMEIIRHQDELYDGTGKPDHLRGEQIPIGARIIKVVKDYDFFVAGANNPRRMHTKSAQSYLRQQSEVYYDPKVVEAFITIVSAVTRIEEGMELCVSLSEVRPGMVIKRDIYLPNGNLMLTAGNAMSEPLLRKLKELEQEMNMPIPVYIG